MNKNYIMILILLIIFSCGCVSAETMVQHTFGHDFTMLVPEDSNFEKVESEFYKDLPFEEIDYADDKNNIVVGYINDSMISEENMDCNYDELFKLMNPDLKECIEYQENNVKVLEPKKKSDKNFAVVGLNQNNKTVILLGNDANILKNMLSSIEFNSNN